MRKLTSTLQGRIITYFANIVFFAGLLLVLVCNPGALRAASSATEYQVKVAYLYHFTQFVEWPATTQAVPRAEFNLCVMGAAPFFKALAPLAKRTHSGHPITIRYLSSAREARSCHLLYIGSALAGSEAAVLELLSDVPVLTVSSQPNFVDSGGVIEFIRVGRNVRFAINRTACIHHGLSCSAKLLEVAIRVVETRPAEVRQ